MSILSPARNIPAHLMLPRMALLVAVFALTLLGLVMVYSAGSVEAISNGLSSTYYLLRQFAIALAGLVGLLVVWKIIPFQMWTSRVVYLVWLIAFAILVFTAVIGYAALGATRWISIGGIRFQPSEYVKIVIVLMASYIINRYFNGEIDGRRAIGETVVLIGMPLALILFAQSDLGTTAICSVAIIAVMWIGGVRKRTVLIVIGVIAVVAVCAIAFKSYRSARMLVFLNPWNDGYDGAGDGYQIIHSYYAFAEGGLFGVGIGNSSEKFLYLPEAETDFIFAIIGEELGMVGAIVVVALFLVVLWAGLRIAQSAATPVSAMIAGGLTVMLVFQAFLNIGCVIGILPTTGKPLPFISYGGSSISSSLLMVGFILSVSDETAGANRFDRKNRGGFEVIKGGR